MENIKVVNAKSYIIVHIARQSKYLVKSLKVTRRLFQFVWRLNVSKIKTKK